jgi:hypothetical protein
MMVTEIETESAVAVLDHLSADRTYGCCVGGGASAQIEAHDLLQTLLHPVSQRLHVLVEDP